MIKIFVIHPFSFPFQRLRWHFWEVKACAKQYVTICHMKSFTNKTTSQSQPVVCNLHECTHQIVHYRFILFSDCWRPLVCTVLQDYTLVFPHIHSKSYLANTTQILVNCRYLGCSKLKNIAKYSMVMRLQKPLEHAIAYNGSAKIPTTQRAQDCLFFCGSSRWQSRWMNDMIFNFGFIHCFCVFVVLA
jgi:hypothetical protein